MSGTLRACPRFVLYLSRRIGPRDPARPGHLRRQPASFKGDVVISVRLAQNASRADMT
jgi:hypothetical protein